MIKRKILHRERGALSLLWTAVIIGALSTVAMVGLFSMRYERNYFAEGWKRMIGATGTAASIDQAKQKAGQVAATGATTSAIRKCIVNGAVTYSNVECDTKNATSKKVELHDSRGFEAPKVPVVENAQDAAPATMQDKLIEKAINR